MPPAPNVVVIASAMVDMIAYADELPSAGQTITGSDFALGFGGKGANQAVMARRLGSEVHLTACLGDDVFGQMALDHYRSEGIELSQVRQISGATSGVAPIWVDATGENRIVIVPGANAHLSPEQAVEAVHAPTSVDVVLSQMETPQESTYAAFKLARERGATTILNLAPAIPLIEGMTALADWIILNESEFSALTALAVKATPWDDAELTAGAKKLESRLVLTIGSAGAVVIAEGKVTRIRAPKVRHVVDTTGAGDAFVGAFAHLIAAGALPEKACEVAVACASLSVTRHGTQSSFPSTSEAMAIVGSTKVHNPVETI